MTIWAVPGFLGLSSDWNHLQMDSIRGIDPFKFTWHSPEEWGKKFNDYIRKQKSESNILLGYSLGGRLALHALIDDPGLWDGAIIVSAHPGISDPTERLKRVENDKKWADLFLTEEWNVLMQKWNQQTVFTHETFHFKRQEKDFRREDLAHTLLYASQGKQADLKDQIENLVVPQLWIVGEKDKRYFEMSKDLSFRHAQSRIVSIPGACHRIPWSNPCIFKDILSKQINRIAGFKG